MNSKKIKFLFCCQILSPLYMYMFLIKSIFNYKKIFYLIVSIICQINFLIFQEKYSLTPTNAFPVRWFTFNIHCKLQKLVYLTEHPKPPSEKQTYKQTDRQINRTNITSAIIFIPFYMQIQNSERNLPEPPLDLLWHGASVSRSPLED